MRPRIVARSGLAVLIGGVAGLASTAVGPGTAWADPRAVSVGEITCEPGGTHYRIRYRLVKDLDFDVYLSSIIETPPDPGSPDATGLVIHAGEEIPVSHIVVAGATNPRLDFTWASIDDPTVTGSLSAVPSQPIPDCQPESPAEPSPSPPPPPPPPAQTTPPNSQATMPRNQPAATPAPSATTDQASPTPTPTSSPTTVQPTRTSPAPAVAPPSDSDGSSLGVLVASVLGVLLAAGIAAAAVLLVRRRRAVTAGESSAGDG